MFFWNRDSKVTTFNIVDAKQPLENTNYGLSEVIKRPNYPSKYQMKPLQGKCNGTFEVRLYELSPPNEEDLSSNRRKLRNLTCAWTTVRNEILNELKKPASSWAEKCQGIIRMERHQ